MYPPCCRCVRADHPLELPPYDALLEDGRVPGGGQHGGDQAVPGGSQCNSSNSDSQCNAPRQVSPLTALKFAELSLKAGIPPGVINVLPGTGSVCGQVSKQRSGAAAVTSPVCRPSPSTPW